MTSRSTSSDSRSRPAPAKPAHGRRAERDVGRGTSRRGGQHVRAARPPLLVDAAPGTAVGRHREQLLHRFADGDEAQRRARGPRDRGGAVEREPRLGRAVETDADDAESGARGAAVSGARCHGHGAVRAVQRAQRGLARQDATQPGTVRGAEDQQVGVQAPGRLAQGAPRIALADDAALGVQPGAVELGVEQRLGRARVDRRSLAGVAVHMDRDELGRRRGQPPREGEGVAAAGAAVDADEDAGEHDGLRAWE